MNLPRVMNLVADLLDAERVLHALAGALALQAHGLSRFTADVEALRRARSLTRLSPEAYLRFLAQFPPPDEAALRARPGPRGEPFKL